MAEHPSIELLRSRVAHYALAFKPRMQVEMLSGLTLIVIQGMSIDEQCVLAAGAQIEATPSSVQGTEFVTLGSKVPVGLLVLGQSSVIFASLQPRRFGKTQADRLEIPYHEIHEVRSVRVVDKRDPAVQIVTTTKGILNCVIPRQFNEADIDPLFDELARELRSRLAA